MVCFSFNEMNTKKTLIELGLGQIISLLFTFLAFSASEVTRQGINAPTTQSFMGYLSLAIVYGGIMLYRRPAIKVKWYNYFLLAFVDVEVNFLVVKAYQYTSLTSVMLLDCWAIPCVLVLTWVFLKTKYRLMKISGVVICIVGVLMVVFSDVHAGDRAGGSNPVKGDLLVLAGTTLSAACDVSEEFLVKNTDMTEVLAFFGIFGTIVAAVQISILERSVLKEIHWSTETILLYLGVALALFLLYSLVAVLIQTNGATIYNLSLLTSDMWAVLIRTFGYHEKVDWLYLLAFATTAIGLLIYSMKEKDEEKQRSGEVVSEQRKFLDEEDGESLRSSLIVAST
ncbi:PREDICTED: solute carrier family 35 member F1-like isoform X2 [Camelina sativa]|uniref:Solute carrier family 35 member F1-like isoform X2 n=1 Tax=Camelina sativa TaxID=90675 RepID=A0ABM0Z948_CAMSA|nr:PREDICTED: solute carrier family 35 member F1-like isoform X2 [Camelina sativa]